MILIRLYCYLKHCNNGGSTEQSLLQLAMESHPDKKCSQIAESKSIWFLTMSASSRKSKWRKVATTTGERRPARRGVERGVSTRPWRWRLWKSAWSGVGHRRWPKGPRKETTGRTPPVNGRAKRLVALSSWTSMTVSTKIEDERYGNIDSLVWVRERQWRCRRRMTIFDLLSLIWVRKRPWRCRPKNEDIWFVDSSSWSTETMSSEDIWFVDMSSWTTVTMSSAAVARGVEFEVVVDDGDDLSCVATSARRQQGRGAAPG